jgi:cellulose synthase (UDP-forming)
MTTIEWGSWFFLPLVLSEAFSVVVTLLYFGTARRIAVPIFRPAVPGQTVDVFIPTYNEPEEVVKMTVIAALHVRGIRKVFVLDDGCRLNIRAMATSLGAEYVARDGNLHAKAGNMNNGIQYSDAEFMLFLDCDHVPQPQIVERLLGYFVDPGLSFVQTPQLFYNVDSIQFRRTADRPLWNEQSMFYESIQPSKNASNSAFFCGSGALVRRAAIDSIGGFATGTATEDIHTSLRLHAQGWRSLFVNEQLAHGIAPMDLTEYHKQRTRWGAGSLGLLFRSPDSPLRARGLTMAQRVRYFNSTFSFTYGLQRIFYIVFPLALILLSPFLAPIAAFPAPYYLLIMLAFVAFSYLCTWIVSDGSYHPIHTEQYNIANMFSHAMALRGIVQVQRKFSVSNKAKVASARSWVEFGIIALCVALAAADLFGLTFWYLSDQPWAGLLHSMLGLALFWNTLNLALIVPFVLFLRAHTAKGIPVGTIAVPSQPATLARDDFTASVAVIRLDLTGATLRIPGGGITPGDYQLRLDTPNGPIQIPAAVGEIRYDGADIWKVDAHFAKLPQPVAVALTLQLFHRIVPQTLRYGRVPDWEQARSPLWSMPAPGPAVTFNA